jgi:hypothetical protein
MKDPMTLFGYLVPTGGKVLITGDEPRGGLIRLGYELIETQKDLRLTRLEPEALDAVWWVDANEKYSIDDAVRILQTLFQGLRPKRGVLVFSFNKESQEGKWAPRTVMTLLRQTGLQLIHTFENPAAYLYFCQRI